MQVSNTSKKRNRDIRRKKDIEFHVLVQPFITTEVPLKLVSKE